MQTATDLKKYELMLIISGELPEASFEKELDEVRKLLKEQTKGISYESSWGKRDLAFRIKRQPRGYYVVFNFTATPESIIELRTNIKLNQSVLRHLFLALPDDYDTVRAQEFMLRGEEKPEEEDKKKRRFTRMLPPEMERTASPRVKEKMPEEELLKPIVSGKDEEQQLKKVEKKLEEILENPDIDVR